MIHTGHVHPISFKASFILYTVTAPNSSKRLDTKSEHQLCMSLWESAALVGAKCYPREHYLCTILDLYTSYHCIISNLRLIRNNSLLIAYKGSWKFADRDMISVNSFGLRV